MLKFITQLMIGTFLVGLVTVPAFAEEGMWTFDNLPIKTLKQKYNFEIIIDGLVCRQIFGSATQANPLSQLFVGFSNSAFNAEVKSVIVEHRADSIVNVKIVRNFTDGCFDFVRKSKCRVDNAE